MKALMAALIAGALVAILLPDEAEARRMGGARSTGVQRQVVVPQKAGPAQQSAQQAGAGAQQSQAASGNRWLGPVAGLLAGLGLGWLLTQGGFGAVFSALLMVLAGFAIYVLLARYARARSEADRVQYAALGQESPAAPTPSPAAGFGAAREPEPAPQALRVPAGFDVPGFLKQAKLNFIRLQEANDRGDIDALREVTTETMFATLSADLAARGGAAQYTDVVNLNASLLEVVTEGDTHWASVRFYGTIREEADAAPAPFEEVWHLQKPVSGGSGWLLAGIQQVS